MRPSTSAPHQNLTRKTPVITTKTVLGVVAAALLAPALLAGCSSSGTTTKPSSQSSANSKAAEDAAFGDCIRSKGFEWDDSGDTGDSTTATLPDGASPEAFDEAITACSKQVSPDGQAGAAELPRDPKADRALGECVRRQGFEDYPDDAPGQAAYEPEDATAFGPVEKACLAEAYDVEVN